MQSYLRKRDHVAVIMDGNGRWALQRGLPRQYGHVEGVNAVEAVVRAAPDLNIGTLTLYAFSSDNWRRPAAEVDALFELFRQYFRTRRRDLIDNGVRLTVIGRRDRLPDGLADEIAGLEADTRAGRRLYLRIALDYSARHAILEAAASASGDAPLTSETFARHVTGGVSCPDVDLLVRTSGEQRLSDFLLWECAYAELYFTPCLWPDFGAEELAAAMRDFRRRNRRFGGLAEHPCLETDPCTHGHRGTGDRRPSRSYALPAGQDAMAGGAE
ncbi:undecaprenyl diphosphate synthase [Rhodobium orientis]|uniref:Isoprenyl transferase n=1 Tax=Rhodobium orientis TaxID=34017 RepID=A0A327JVD5_9HYPH|nr:di-trans,poly-cis-decaprenylcistransferase [Rhodobium orientis]MBB4303994.1 undecaprenyl diphosphate synthase [Rhodobium orientis]MBK5950796.1 di-trans,poly-cis-decaprenylcistransferase [Rhodobium orientis]RAI29536.1 di-trans,poly-cis-decaprenylcistransferase [Rhodobium orientis]